MSADPDAELRRTTRRARTAVDSCGNCDKTFGRDRCPRCPKALADGGGTIDDKAREDWQRWIAKAERPDVQRLRYEAARCSRSIAITAESHSAFPGLVAEQYRLLDRLAELGARP